MKKSKKYIFKYKNLDFYCFHYIDTKEVTFWYDIKEQEAMLLFFNLNDFSTEGTQLWWKFSNNLESIEIFNSVRKDKEIYLMRL